MRQHHVGQVNIQVVVRVRVVTMDPIIRYILALEQQRLIVHGNVMPDTIKVAVHVYRVLMPHLRRGVVLLMARGC